MFLNTKYFVALITYILICFAMSKAEILYSGVIYVEDFREMNIFSFIYEFYSNIFTTITKWDLGRDMNSEILIIGARLALCFFFIGFAYGAIEDRPLLLPITYFIVAPIFLYLTSSYVESLNYVAFQSNSISYIGSLIIGLSIGTAMIMRDKRLEFSHIAMALAATSVLYVYEISEFQSTLLLSNLFLIGLGIIIGGIYSIITKESQINEPIDFQIKDQIDDH